ncbi:MAG TPA: N-acetylmuramoyl-L-alanine amidase [Candidatus Hydrogenedentes bacterium]|nr:N-acetylmuramoyl-L-alanine amidase [Candidatus Hydrogenedentota bacterium]
MKEDAMFLGDFMARQNRTDASDTALHRRCLLEIPALRRAGCFAALIVIGMPVWAQAAILRVPLQENTYALLRHGRSLFLECHPPSGEAARGYYAGLLADVKKWKTYAAASSVVVPFSDLAPDVQRRVLLAVFPDDMVDSRGWWHKVELPGAEGVETLWSLCEWLTGRGTYYTQVMAVNRIASNSLRPGQMVLVPREFLRDAMRRETPERIAQDETDASSDLDRAKGELVYGSDAQGIYAEYRLRPGEALYTAVVVRFTDIRENADILNACETVRTRSGIEDVYSMPPGTRVLIPVNMLADRFKPASSPDRKEYEEGLREARKLRGQVTSKDLEGVAVVLDPGHGGRDVGALYEAAGLYEDEINYDIVCRVKKILEEETRARVYITMRDRKQGYAPRDCRVFSADADEEVLTSPPYRNEDAKVSVNLRWHLANDIYRKELKKGTDPRKIVFTSFHCDALFNEKLRGAMIYIPGAKQAKNDGKDYSSGLYRDFAEVRERPSVVFTQSERRRDEALSRNFAETVLGALARERIKRHDVGDPIRTTIRQNGGVQYVPAVLRNNAIPTKVLIEAANLTNPTDRERLADPAWRQRFARAYVNALRAHFGS